MVVILVVTGKRSEVFGILKKIFVTIFGSLIPLLAIKYIGDASSEISSAGFGLYIMLIGGILIVIGAYIPEHKLTCFLGKFFNKNTEQ